MECPFTKERVALVPALKPDVAIVQAQRADEEGNTHFWGGSGVTKEAALAARKVIVVVEEVVSKKVIQRDPHRTLIPGFLVNAVIPERWGAHPSPIQGYYNRDHEQYIDYHHESRGRDGYLEWLGRWVLGMRDREEYLKLLGEEKVKSLLVKRHKKSLPVDYGDETSSPGFSTGNVYPCSPSHWNLRKWNLEGQTGWRPPVHHGRSRQQ
jgi:glutaconate CoA-transferase subunit A